MKMYYAMVAIALLVLAGCASQIAKEQTMKEETGTEEILEPIEQEVAEEILEPAAPEKNTEVLMETEDSDMKVEYTGENTDEWCQTGSAWKVTGDEGQANMKIVGLETAGKYSGYCHVRYDVDMEDAQGNMDFYFNQEGAGYQVIDINGQKMETAWSQ